MPLDNSGTVIGGGSNGGDPYAGTGFEQGGGRITQRPQGDQRDAAYWRANIINSFLDFGYYPTQAEVASLVQSSSGQGGEQMGQSAVAQYVNQQKAEIERQKVDPLAAVQKKMQDSADLYKTQVQGLYGQLQDVLGSAPQLFGNLTPDQIQTYLAPLQTSFKQQLDQVQGVIASRGLTGSSTENNAFAQTNQQFKENVLSTGLSVGQQSQQAKASAISDQIKSLLGLSGSEEAIAGGAAGQRSAQNLGQSNLIQSLPFFLDQAALVNQLVQKQINPGGGFMDTFHKVTSGINEGVNAFQSLMMIPGQFKTASPGAPGASPYAAPSSPNLPGADTTSTAAPQLASLFATA